MLSSAQNRRRRLSMTSLIDVIFLLLLFFMLSSTFSRFAEVELHAAEGGAAQVRENAIAFLRTEAGAITLNGTDVDVEDLEDRLHTLREKGALTLLVSVTAETTAQKLTDILVTVRQIPDLPVRVLGAS